MPRIQINDLPSLDELSETEMKGLYGEGKLVQRNSRAHALLQRHAKQKYRVRDVLLSSNGAWWQNGIRARSVFR